ncbi:MAG: hypothetical protein CVU91_06865 [Firmicutes bacterium HGW-Firmicutes-16]|nr:MAG: hypothetical protein CVU91_06865 [Firmicutes bacterium HGW-Firmicutes-16]
MKKKIMSALISVSLLISLSGCAGLFQKEYLSVSEYKDNAQSASNSDVMHISDYTELKDAVISLVNDHKTEGRLRFTDYDGTIQSDLAQALLEVKTESALASFAVNYMSYDLSRIVTYYEAVVYITYKRTQSEIDTIKYITGRTQLTETLAHALDEMDSYIALRITSSTITADEISSDINAAYTENPASCVVPPRVSVRMHPQTGLQRIIEIELEYGWKLSELQKMKSSLTEKMQKIVSDASDDKKVNFALNLYQQLAQFCAYDPTGSLRSNKAELDSGLGSTAYGALVEGYADSKGMAAAYSALCYAAGIDCTVVNGKKAGEDHSWNITKLDGSYYHVDATGYYTLGITHSFMQSDEQMKSGYEWDAVSYPICSGGESYIDIIKKVF